MLIYSIKIPLWLRVVLLVAVVILGTGAGVFAYRYYKHPIALTVAVGSIDGESVKAMKVISNRLVSDNDYRHRYCAWRRQCIFGRENRSRRGSR
jgi:hypothetical protein